MTSQPEYYAIKNAITSTLKKAGAESKGVFDLKEYVAFFAELTKSQEKSFQKAKDTKEFHKKGGPKK